MTHRRKNERWITFVTAGVLLLAGQAGRTAEPERAFSLPKDPAEALRLEQRDALPLTSFYDTPTDLSKSKPGDLLRKEAVRDYDLPEGVSAQRVLYHSLDASGAAVAASAVVLLPAGQKPASGWPIIAWAHGTSGVAQHCAPSAMKSVYYGRNGLYEMLGAGFAIVAVDYSGLGTKGPHEYLSKVAQANDVIYAVPAARAAVPDLGDKWVVDGHSQGGQAAWGVAEKQAVLKQPGYLGAVSVAGATLHDGWLVAHPDTTDDAAFYAAWLVYGISARFPEFKPGDALTPTGAKHYEAITTKGCWVHGYTLYSGITYPQMLKQGWSENPWVQKFFAENRAGVKPIHGPLLAIAGDADKAVPLAAVRDVVDRACRNHQPVELRIYAGLDHGPTMGRSVPDQIAWIKDRFAGKPAKGNCPAR
jgi:pimeloyl-ACP methyl ester carboxylesterase